MILPDSVQKFRVIGPFHDREARRLAPGMFWGIPWGFALLVWTRSFHLFLLYPKAILPIISKTWWYLLVAPSLILIFLALLLPIYLKRDGLSLEELGFRVKPRARDFALGVAMGVCIKMVNLPVLKLGMWLTHGAPVNVSMIEQIELMGVIGPAEGLGLLFVCIIRAPILEELLYRGVVITSLRACWGSSRRNDLIAAVVSGAIFSMAHGLGHSLYYGVYFLIGLALAILYQRTGSLNAVMIAHAVINGIPSIKAYVSSLLAG